MSQEVLDHQRLVRPQLCVFKLFRHFSNHFAQTLFFSSFHTFTLYDNRAKNIGNVYVSVAEEALWDMTGTLL